MISHAERVAHKTRINSEANYTKTSVYNRVLSLTLPCVRVKDETGYV
jgi:hypothetical protein